MAGSRTLVQATVMVLGTLWLGLGCSNAASDSNNGSTVGGSNASTTAKGGGATRGGSGSTVGGNSSSSKAASGGAPGDSSSNSTWGGQSGTELAVGGSSAGGHSPNEPLGGGSSRGGQAGSSSLAGKQFGGASVAGSAVKGGSSAQTGGDLGGNSSGGRNAGAGAPSNGGVPGAAGAATRGGATANAGEPTIAGMPAAGGTRPQAGAPGYGGGGATSLKEKYADYFPIGAAVDDNSYKTHAEILTKHFNSITAEDQMKFDALEPSENRFEYGGADPIVSFASTNNMKVRGHTLVWHRQNPSWVFTNSSGGAATKEVVLARMKNHITQVMKHFKGKIYAWDVVNEAIMDNGAYRTGDESKDDQKSQWHKILGESYIAEAFKCAHEADPDAKLFYNDFYDYLPAKRQAIYNMLKGLLDSGVTLHGVGMQTHINIEPSTDSTNQAYYQHVSELEEAIKLYSSLGLEVQVTEMDVSLYIPGVTYTSGTYYTTATFTDALKAKQAERYREFFALFRKYKTVITGVTLWGLADDNTWLSEFSSGRKDFPLLFDVDHKAKTAYYAVVDF